MTRTARYALNKSDNRIRKNTASTWSEIKSNSKSSCINDDHPEVSQTKNNQNKKRDNVNVRNRRPFKYNKIVNEKMNGSTKRNLQRQCFRCRKPGHFLADCPELTSDCGTGICYKCGSTEHSYRECKIVKGDNFKNALCFICKQMGHITKQCPDNPRGLYPNGGCCNLCGDVTHLRIDCPDAIKESEKSVVYLDVFNDRDNVELMDQTVQKKPDLKKKKVVKF